MSRPAQWDTRFDRILTVLRWTALALGVVLSVVGFGVTLRVALAALVVGVFTVVAELPPLRRSGSVGGAATVAVSGVLAALVAIAFTGLLDSAYLFALTVPVFGAAAGSGLRTGGMTALLAIVGLATLVAAGGDPVAVPVFFQVSLFIALVALTFSEARRILVEEAARAAALTEAAHVDADRLERLEAAHTLLLSLGELANTAELNPVTVGRAALRDLARTVPFDAATVGVLRNGALVEVARRGPVPGPGAPRTHAIRLGTRVLGEISMWAGPGVTLAGYDGVVEASLRPVALALDNILLLRDIAHRAVREERTRLARELHDEIGPTLASIGLGLDVALEGGELEPGLRTHLETLRGTTGRLVEEVRATVADLRAVDSTSLVEQAHALAFEVGADGPAIVVSLEERRPPRTSVAPELGAIMAEAVRNALEHSGASVVRIEGTVDRDDGRIAVADDGGGFDPDRERPGHFGITGMRERAAAIGATVTIASTADGTTVTIAWGNPP